MQTVQIHVSLCICIRRLLPHTVWHLQPDKKCLLCGLNIDVTACIKQSLSTNVLLKYSDQSISVLYICKVPKIECTVADQKFKEYDTVCRMHTEVKNKNKSAPKLHLQTRDRKDTLPFSKPHQLPHISFKK